MNTFFLENKTLNKLVELMKDEEGSSIEESVGGLVDALKEAKVISANEEGEEVVDEMAEAMIQTYLTCADRVILHYNKEDRINIKGLYFEDDFIVMLTAYRDGGEFMWLPTIKHVIGSVIEDLQDEIIELDHIEENELDCPFIVDDTNFKEVITGIVPDGMYKETIVNHINEGDDLWVKYIENSNEVTGFVYVVFEDNNAFYYRIKDQKLTYGMAGRTGIINILSDGMIKMHRKLIMQLDEEDMYKEKLEQ